MGGCNSKKALEITEKSISLFIELEKCNNDSERVKCLLNMLYNIDTLPKKMRPILLDKVEKEVKHVDSALALRPSE
jgi:hypothetical protein